MTEIKSKVLWYVRLTSISNHGSSTTTDHHDCESPIEAVMKEMKSHNKDARVTNIEVSRVCKEIFS